VSRQSPSDATVAFEPISEAELNACLIAWDHQMGPRRRPSPGWAHGLRYRGELLAVAATDTLIRARVAGFSRQEAVELSRLCACRADLCRVALRLWRVFVFSSLTASHGYRWAVSYQDVARHTGDIYRFDGWVRLARSRSGRDPRTGRIGCDKIVWGWCEDGAERVRRRDAVAVPPTAPADERGRGGCLVS